MSTLHEVDNCPCIFPVLALHGGVLVLQLLRPPVVLLGDPERLAELGLGLGDVLSLLLGQLDIYTG